MVVPKKVASALGQLTPLVFVHGAVSDLDGRVQGAVGGPDTEPNRGGDVRVLKSPPDASGLDLPAGAVGLNGEDGEFVSPEACNEIRRASRRRQHVCAVTQQSVSGRMTLGVIDQFELVEVDHQHGAGVAVTPAASLLGGHNFVPAAAVCEIR